MAMALLLAFAVYQLRSERAGIHHASPVAVASPSRRERSLLSTDNGAAGRQCFEKGPSYHFVGADQFC